MKQTTSRSLLFFSSVFTIVLLTSVCLQTTLCDVINDQPPLIPGIPVPEDIHDHHCEGGHGHAPHEHNEAHEHYLREPRFLDGLPTDWMNQGSPKSDGGGGGGFVPKEEKDEL